jgi:pilus assembly protein Flp/PilA
MDKFINTLRSFLRDEEGAQVIEYALIIAVISIILVIGLRGLNGNFSTFIARVANCLTTTTCG